MYALMSLQIELLTECLITHITAKWPLTTMYSLMVLQFPLLSEPLITHIAAILALLLEVSASAL
jgi:hypothetical protein